MPAIYTCDECGSVNAHPDYDGRILCVRHHAQRDLEYERRSLRNMQETHLKCIEPVQQRIEKLEAEI